jgi:hypothetical protein
MRFERFMAPYEDIAQASALLQAGDYRASAAVSSAILAREPRNAIAAHLLGLALKDAGDWAQGWPTRSGAAEL